MLTEGTDVPDVQTVFLTRQTTSLILLTQMVGRGLRGRTFGGTETAYIVSFIDKWTHRIDWAAYDPLNQGEADDSAPDYGSRPPIQLVSIDLVRRLTDQMDSGNNTNPSPVQDVSSRRLVSGRAFGGAIRRGASRAGASADHGL